MKDQLFVKSVRQVYVISVLQKKFGFQKTEKRAKNMVDFR